MTYSLYITNKAVNDLNAAAGYIELTLSNAQAADDFLKK